MNASGPGCTLKAIDGSNWDLEVAGKKIQYLAFRSWKKMYCGDFNDVRPITEQMFRLRNLKEITSLQPQSRERTTAIEDKVRNGFIGGLKAIAKSLTPVA